MVPGSCKFGESVAECRMARRASRRHACHLALIPNVDKFAAEVLYYTYRTDCTLHTLH
jgi:hypothetical protein